jgi:hypothetical protein
MQLGPDACAGANRPGAGDMAAIMNDRDGMVRRISAALDHIDKHGNLQSFAGEAEESEALISAATSQQLIEWNPDVKRYRLAPAARKWLKVYYRGRGSRTAG